MDACGVTWSRTWWSPGSPGDSCPHEPLPAVWTGRVLPHIGRSNRVMVEVLHGVTSVSTEEGFDPLVRHEVARGPSELVGLEG